MGYLEQISQSRIDPPDVASTSTVTELIDRVFLSYNSGRLREACQVFVRKMLAQHCTIGLSLSGALTPAGLGRSCLVPLIRAGFVDWIVSTGANLYHDTHFALDMPLHQSFPHLDDARLHEQKLIRIYDIVFEGRHLLDTDEFYRRLLAQEPFQRVMGSAELHGLVGKYLAARDQELGRPASSLLATAHELGVPIYTSSPGDSTIGMNIAELALRGSKLRIDPSIDVNETAAIVYDADRRAGSGVVILGGGSPKNFLLQTAPHIQELLGLPGRGQDYFLQFTDARPDTGGLSGATPSEAMTWGKVDPDKLPDSVTCYVDSTIALPLLTAYALANHPPRPHGRLYDRREQLVAKLQTDYLEQKRAT